LLQLVAACLPHEQVTLMLRGCCCQAAVAACCVRPLWQVLLPVPPRRLLRSQLAGLLPWQLRCPVLLLVLARVPSLHHHQRH
jgi:hypothetical protein